MHRTTRPQRRLAQPGATRAEPCAARHLQGHIPLRMLACLALAGVIGLPACTTPPGGTAPGAAPAAQPASAGAANVPVSAPATPAAAPADPPPPASPASAQQAQRLAVAAVELLEVGNEEQALAEIQRALQADPHNRLAQSLLKQVQTDPQVLLGRESFAYRVEPGESLSRIAGRFLKDVHLFYALARYNDIKVPRQVQGGQLIKVPGKQPPPAAPVAAPAPAPAPAPVAAPAPAPKPPAVDTRPAVDVVVNNTYRRGLALLEQQKPDEAVPLFDQVLEREPAHANARLKRAQAMRQINDLIRLLDASIRRLDAELARNPGNAAARTERERSVAKRERLQSIK